MNILKVIKSLLLFVCLFSCSQVVSAQDIIVKEDDWIAFKQDYEMLKENNRNLKNTLTTQTENSQKLREQLQLSEKQLNQLATQVQASKKELKAAKESNNQMKKSLDASTKELKKLKPRTIGVSVGMSVIDSKVKPAILLKYHSIQVAGNSDYISIFYNII